MKYNFLKNYNIEKIREFLETRNKKVLVFDSDCDGLCSAVLIAKVFPGFGIVPKRGPKITPEFLQAMIRTKAELFVFLDMAVDYEWQSLKKLKRALPKARIVIIDHHIPEKNISSKDIIHINPLLFKEAYQPTSYIAYRIMEKIEKKIKEFVWLSALGCFADYGYKDVKGLYKECEKYYPYLAVKIRNGKLDSNLKKGVEIIESVILIKGLEGAKGIFDFLLKIEKYQDLEKSKELRKYWKMAEKEFNKTVKVAEKGKEVIKEAGLIVFGIKTKYSLTSAISTYLSEKYPNKTIIVRRKSGDVWKLSIRNQSGKVNVGEVVKKCAKGLGSGGGHKKAAGAQINDWDKFKNRVIKVLKQKRF